MTRILIADDHDVVRAGLRTILEEQPGWEVVGEAADG
jgi:DNA-binding NarL/FixJ family response regulator